MNLEDVGWTEGKHEAVRAMTMTENNENCRSKMFLNSEVELSGVSGHHSHGTGGAIGFLLH